MQLPVLNSFGTSRLENVNISSKNAELTGENLFLQEIDGNFLLEEGISEGRRHVVRIQRALLNVVLEVSKDICVSLKLYRKQGCAKSKFFLFYSPLHASVSFRFTFFSKTLNFGICRGFREDKEKRNSRYASVGRANKKKNRTSTSRTLIVWYRIQK